MVQSQGFLIPHVLSSLLAFCAVFFQQQVGAAPPNSPNSSQELGSPTLVPLGYPATWRWQPLPSRL